MRNFIYRIRTMDGAYIRLQRKFKVYSDWYLLQLNLIIFEYAPPVLGLYI